MLVYDLYYEAVDNNGLQSVHTETFHSLHDLVRDFHNRIKHMSNFIRDMGYEERNVNLTPVPEPKPAYTLFFNKP